MGKKKNVAVEEEVVETPEVMENVELEEPVVVDEPTPVEVKPEAPKGKVEIKEEECKSVNLLKAPEEIRKIIQFYGLTGKDLFEWKLDGVKADEAKALKEWYATLA